MHFSLYICFLLAPQNFSVEYLGSSTALVNIVGVKGHPDGVLYKATAGCGPSMKECRVMREANVLRCRLVGLSPVTRYDISVRSCLLGDVCGEALKMK